MYIIIRCLDCGQPLIAKPQQKTKNCTYCGKRLNVSEAKVFARADTARQATRIIIAMKNPNTESNM